MGAGSPYASPINSMHGMMNQTGPYPMGGNVANNSAGEHQTRHCSYSATDIGYKFLSSPSVSVGEGKHLDKGSLQYMNFIRRRSSDGETQECSLIQLERKRRVA